MTLIDPSSTVTVGFPGALGNTVATALNVAVTVVSAVSVTVQVPVPLQPPPDQPANAEPAVALADSVTVEPWVAVVEHVAPQLMPAGDDDTVPEPVPDFVTPNV